MEKCNFMSSMRQCLWGLMHGWGIKRLTCPHPLTPYPQPYHVPIRKRRKKHDSHNYSKCCFTFFEREKKNMIHLYSKLLLCLLERNAH